MSTVLSLFLFVAAIAYVEYRLKRINAEKDDNSKEAFRFFATKEELKSAVKSGDALSEEFKKKLQDIFGF